MANKKVYFFKVNMSDLKGNRMPVGKYKELFEEIIDKYAVNNTVYRSRYGTGWHTAPAWRGTAPETALLSAPDIKNNIKRQR